MRDKIPRPQTQRRRPPRARREADRRAFEGSLASPIGPPPRRSRPPSRADRRQRETIEHTLHRASFTGQALTEKQSRRAVSKYGFLAANMIEMGLRHLAFEQQQQLQASRGITVSRAEPTRHKSIFERVSTAGYGVLPDSSAIGRAVNLVTSVPREATAIGIGLGQLAGRGGYDVSVDLKNIVADPHSPLFVHSRRTASALARGVASDYATRYGTGFQESLQKRGPLPYLLDIAGGVGAVTRVGSIAKAASEARGAGLSPLEAIRQGYHKSINPIDPRLDVPGAARTLPLPGRAGRTIPLSWSRSPIGRYFQRAYDDYSITHPERGRTGLYARTAKRAVRLERQQERRVRVGQARNIAAVRHPAGRFRGKKAADIRLFWEGNLPPAFRTNEGLQAVKDYLQRQQLSPRRVRDLEPTARLVSARARHEKLLARYERAVGKSKQQLAKQLDKAGADMRAAEDSIAVISRRKAALEADPAGAVARARARLDEINGTLDRMVQAIEGDLKARMGGKFDPAETMRRTKYKQEAQGKRGKRAQARGRLEETRTQAQELRDDAWLHLQRRAEADDQAGRTIRQLLDEHDQLRDLVDEHDEKFLFKEPPAAGAPPVPAGHVRLYRGEGAQTNVRTTPAIAADRGRWFTDNRRQAEGMAARENGVVYYVDVPKDVAAKSVAHAADEFTNWNEYVLPAEHAARKIEDQPSNLGRGKYRGEPGRLGGAVSVAADELQALERRHLTRIGQGRDQLQANLDTLNQRIHRAGEGTDTRAQLEERAARLQAAIDQADQFTAARGYLAHEQLGRRIEELDQAMQHTPDERYHAALAGAEALTADLEKITGSILQPEHIGLLEQRRGLLGRMVGLDTEDPSTIFAPHRETRTGGRIRESAGLGAPRGRKISGTTSSTALGLRKQNRGILVETGRVDPNLDHLIVQWGRAQSWRFVQSMRDLMYDAGDEIPVGSTPRPGWYVVDRKSRANEQLFDNAELGDDAALHQGLEDFVNSSVWREGEKAVQTYEEMRQIHPAFIEAIFREAGVDLPGKTGRLRQSLETGGAPFDLVNGLVRTSLLYANPGYYPANFIGNLVFMGLHQHGFALPNIIRAGQTYFHDRELFDLISAEVGMGPTEALSAKTAAGGGFLDRALNLERRGTHVAAAIPDNWPRVAAWFYEARQAGAKTPEAMKDLLRGENPELRQQVSDRAVEAMVNFERTSPLERATLGRVFFVWPWIRGATAWAGHYMREFPERTAVLSPVAAEEHRQDLIPFAGGVPAYLENLVPLNKAGSRVLNIGSVSPSATAAQLIQTFAGTVNSLVNNVPPPKYQGISDMINPLLDFAWFTIHSETSFGQQVGPRTALERNALELAPLVSTGMEAAGKKPVSKVYSDDSARAVLERRWGRVIPFGVNPQAVKEAAAAATKGPAQTPQGRMDTWIHDVTKTLGSPNEAIRRARRNQMLYEQASQAYKDRKYGSTRHSITDREEAALLLSVDASQFAARWDPAVLSRRQQDIRDGSPAFVRSFIRDERHLLWEQLLSQVNRQMGVARRSQEDRRYARSHGG